METAAHEIGHKLLEDYGLHMTQNAPSCFNTKMVIPKPKNNIIFGLCIDFVKRFLSLLSLEDLCLCGTILVFYLG